MESPRLALPTNVRQFHRSAAKYTLNAHFLFASRTIPWEVKNVLFTESPTFTKAVQEILREQDYFDLQDLLMDRPDAGDVIPGSRGLRKIRVASGGKGKRGGSRVIYYWYFDPEKNQFCRIYEKTAQSDLSKTELQQIQTELDP